MPYLVTNEIIFVNIIIIDEYIFIYILLSLVLTLIDAMPSGLLTWL
jgi:hypothetical protein